ncbi:MAG TPA: cbb3-type cytochrome c oxidase subunit 3 [Rubrivivax sp.]|nr:cbb3-type cytochrome c oxidase subunit 3 [Burkholderiales bacterium]HNU11562.1 cbb3-type cytochrome c oxidase subunit 3 [Rubrivivax sp.]
MNPVWGHLIGVFIVVLMLVFIGIWIWAWLPSHKRSFNELARMPMDDRDASAAIPAGGSGEERR